MTRERAEAIYRLAYEQGRDDERARCAAWARAFVLKHEKVRKDATWGGQGGRFCDAQLAFHEAVEWEFRDLLRAVARGDTPPERVADEPDRDDDREGDEPEDERGVLPEGV